MDLNTGGRPSSRSQGALASVPPLALGTGPLGNLYQPIPDGQAVELIGDALARGVTFFDTAPLYGLGEAERKLGLGLRGVERDQLTLATKVGRLLQGGSFVWDFSRDGVLRSIEGSLRRLGVDRLDIVHVHDPDHHLGPVVTQAYPALLELRSQGVIRAIGAGMNQFERMLDLAEFCDFDCFLLAGRYTLLTQAAAPFLDRCRALGAGVFLAGVYNSGILATGAVPGAKYMYVDAPPGVRARVQAIEAVCARHGVSLRAAALQFARAHPAVRALVVGAQSRGEFADTLDGLSDPIPAAFWQELAGAGIIDGAAPLPR